MTILVAVDLSIHEFSALEYAASLAAACDGTLHLLHVNKPATSGNEKLASTLRLHTLQKKLRHDYGLHSSFDVAEGTVSEEILEAALRTHPDLIVMGTQSNLAAPVSFFGSVTAQVIDRAQQPVLAIPPGFIYSTPARIVFGSAKNRNDLAPLRELTTFANLFDAKIEVVRIVNRFDHDEQEIDQPVVRSFRNVVDSHSSYRRVHCEEYQHTDPAEGILCFVEEEGADLLALSQDNRLLVDKLLAGSLGNECAYQLEVPLLCLCGPNTDGVTTYREAWREI